MARAVLTVMRLAQPLVVVDWTRVMKAEAAKASSHLNLSSNCIQCMGVSRSSRVGLSAGAFHAVTGSGKGV